MSSPRAVLPHAAAIGSFLVMTSIAGCVSHQGNPIAAPAPVPADLAQLCSADPAIVMTPVPSRGVDEPYLALPTPDGWEVNHSRDSALVRAALVNTDLRTKRFTPSVIVTLADVSEDSASPGQAIVTEQGGVEAQPAVREISAQDGTVCGYPSRTLRYRYEGRDATTVLIAGTDRNKKTWICTVGIQTADPGNPQFVRDKAVILEKFQFVTQRDGNV